MYNQIEYVKYANLDCSHDVHTEERSLGCHLENTLFQYNNSFLAEERAFKKGEFGHFYSSFKWN